MTTSEKLTVGTIGAGRVAQQIAGLALRGGHRVVFSNSRGPESLAGLVAEFGPGASAGTVAEAARADVVVLAVGWDQVSAALEGGPDLAGRIVVDTTNQWHHHDPAQVADLGDLTGSEYIASLMPGARVVKAFNTVFMNVVARNVEAHGDPLVIFLAGDDADAKATVSAVVDGAGLVPVDLGGLRDGGRLMQAGGPLIALHLEKVAG